MNNKMIGFAAQIAIMITARIGGSGCSIDWSSSDSGHMDIVSRVLALHNTECWHLLLEQNDGA